MTAARAAVCGPGWGECVGEPGRPVTFGWRRCKKVAFRGCLCPRTTHGQTNGPQFRDVGPAVHLPDRMRTLGHLIGILEESLRLLGVLGIVLVNVYLVLQRSVFCLLLA